MDKSVEGIYRNGKIELADPIIEAEGSRVIVTWVEPLGQTQLDSLGLDESQALDLRQRLSTFAEDWERPEMNVYDRLPPQ